MFSYVYVCECVNVNAFVYVYEHIQARVYPMHLSRSMSRLMSTTIFIPTSMFVLGAALVDLVDILGATVVVLVIVIPINRNPSALHEKGLQRQIGVHTLDGSQERRALAVPLINR